MDGSGEKLAWTKKIMGWGREWGGTCWWSLDGPVMGLTYLILQLISSVLLLCATCLFMRSKADFLLLCLFLLFPLLLPPSPPFVYFSPPFIPLFSLLPCLSPSWTLSFLPEHDPYAIPLIQRCKSSVSVLQEHKVLGWGAETGSGSCWGFNL